ncbi:MAG TPA: SRPBCC family protein [Candidatus Limnocylindrales bacterium]|nr:SRPBCC family protein [Candidatus Limnocylindrales bacterium]
MARYTFSAHVDAPIDIVFDLWTNLDRMREWVGGVTRVTDVTGPIAQAGTRYTTWFGSMKSPTEVVEADRPRLFATRFGNLILKGTNRTTLEPDGNGTRLTQTFETVGLVSAISARLFAAGSYQGSFEGELRAFVKLAEAEAARIEGAAAS